ncbi:MAG: hypothetical protein ACJAY8_001587 [Sphingobacteriales bacterium]|jgi:hypothetical protein
MTLRNGLLLICFLGIGCGTQAQKKAFVDQNYPLGATSNFSNGEVDFFPILTRIEAPKPDGGGFSDYRDALKDKLREKRKKSQGGGQKNVALGTADNPVIWHSFEGNPGVTGVPNDNGVAISPDGFVVSVINSSVTTFDKNGDRLKFRSLQSFADELGIQARKFDPRAVYLPKQDRFVLIYLAGSTSAETFLMLAFSQSNDPTEGWNHYALSGDVDSLNVWSDYPIVSLKENELVVTLNLIRQGEPWETGFEGSIIWEIDLASGTAGTDLETRYWKTVTHNGLGIRNLCAVKNADHGSGDDLWFLSNRNFDEQNDTLWMFHISGDMLDPIPTLTSEAIVLERPYGFPPNAFQLDNEDLATNDSRWLDAIQIGDQIQFVGNTLVPSNNNPGIYHGYLNDIYGTPAISGDYITMDEFDFGYPGIEYIGMEPGSKEVVIGVNYSSDSIHPGYGVIYSDGLGGYSDFVVIKEGSRPIDYLTGVDRWGDYFGIHQELGKPGSVWLSGSYGGAGNDPHPWISNVGHPSKSSVLENSGIEDVAVHVFPNPMVSQLHVDFTVEKSTIYRMELYDMEGRLVDVLLKSKVKPGLNRFSFSLDNLAGSSYILHIIGENGIVKTQTVIKE